MWKLLASLLCVVAVGGPVTVALAAGGQDDVSLPTAADVENEVVRFRAIDQAIERRVERRERQAAEQTRKRRAAERRRERRAAERTRERRERREGGDASPQLEAIAACESGGDPTSVSGSGMYRGKYQFSRETWASVGGSGDPAEAPEAEQDRRAAKLLASAGAGQWPVCGGS